MVYILKDDSDCCVDNRLGQKGGDEDTGEAIVIIIQVRSDGGSSEGGGTFLASVHILKVEQQYFLMYFQE